MEQSAGEVVSVGVGVAKLVGDGIQEQVTTCEKIEMKSLRNICAALQDP